MTRSAAHTRARERVLRICSSAADARTLRLELLHEISPVVGFDAYAWLLTDPETSVGSSPLADVPCLPELPRLVRLKYLTALNRWTILRRPATLVQASGGDLSRSLVWRELLDRYGVTDVASSVFRDRHGCWAFLDLWRIGERFTTADTAFLADIAVPVTAALRSAQASTFWPLRNRRRAGQSYYCSPPTSTSVPRLPKRWTT